jgi:hypothetical protein
MGAVKLTPAARLAAFRLRRLPMVARRRAVRAIATGAGVKREAR